MILPHAVIAVGVCAGAWMVLVQPKVQTLARIAASEQQQPIRLAPDQWQRVGERIAAARTDLDQVAQLNDISLDSNRLFNVMMELGDAHRVQVVSLQPAHVSSRSRRQSKDRASAASVTRLNISAQGTYQNVARFIDAVSEYSPYFRPHSLQLSPVADGPPPIISARLSCEVLSFTIPRELAQLTGADHVE